MNIKKKKKKDADFKPIVRNLPGMWAKYGEGC